MAAHKKGKREEKSFKGRGEEWNNARGWFVRQGAKKDLIKDEK